MSTRNQSFAKELVEEAMSTKIMKRNAKAKIMKRSGLQSSHNETGKTEAQGHRRCRRCRRCIHLSFIFFDDLLKYIRTHSYIIIGCDLSPLTSEVFEGEIRGQEFYMLLSCFIRHFRFPAFPPGFSQCTWHCPFSVDACCGQLGGLDLSEKTQIFQRSSRQARKCAKSFHGILENQNKVSQMQTGSASNEPESNIFRSF